MSLNARDWRDEVLQESGLLKRRGEIEAALVKEGMAEDEARQKATDMAYAEGRKHGRISDGQDLYGAGR